MTFSLNVSSIVFVSSIALFIITKKAVANLSSSRSHKVVL